MKLPKFIRKFVKVKERGWKESEIIESLVALVVAGGEHMEDIDMLSADKAYQKVIGKKGLPSSKAIEQRHRLSPPSLGGGGRRSINWRRDCMSVGMPW